METMTPEEFKKRMDELNRHIELHILVHHSGENAGVIKLNDCQQYQELVAEKLILADRYKQEKANDNETR